MPLLRVFEGGIAWCRSLKGPLHVIRTIEARLVVVIWRAALRSRVWPPENVNERFESPRTDLPWTSVRSGAMLGNTAQSVLAWICCDSGHIVRWGRW